MWVALRTKDKAKLLEEGKKNGKKVAVTQTAIAWPCQSLVFSLVNTDIREDYQTENHAPFSKFWNGYSFLVFFRVQVLGHYKCGAYLQGQSPQSSAGGLVVILTTCVSDLNSHHLLVQGHTRHSWSMYAESVLHFCIRIQMRKANVGHYFLRNVVFQDSVLSVFV